MLTRRVEPRSGASVQVMLAGCRAALEARDTKERVGVVMPGQRTWVPFVGLVVLLSRDDYNPWDHALERIAVVVAVYPAAGVAIVVTRTTHPEPGDIPHGADLSLGCDRPGGFQPATRSYRVAFDAFDDPDTVRYGSLDQVTLGKVLDRWEQG